MDKAKAREFTPVEFEKALRDQAEYHRTEYNYIKAFRKWRVENLDPEIKKLADMAANAPQYDYIETSDPENVPDVLLGKDFYGRKIYVRKMG